MDLICEASVGRSRTSPDTGGDISEHVGATSV